MKERLQKILARAGFGPRRACDDLVAQRRVTVNGMVAAPGTKADAVHDNIVCDGRPVRSVGRVAFAFHKPKGIVTSMRDLQAFLPRRPRVFPVGRLDADSEGLLLLTNDGAFANRVAHPRHQMPKTYRVLLRGELTPLIVEKLKRGVWLSEGRCAPADARVVKVLRNENTTIALVTLREGKYREVRRVFAKFDLKVRKLVRVAIGSLTLGNLRPGQMRALEPDEVNALIKETRDA